MRTLSLDLRERIMASYDAKEGTREDIARRYRVSLGMVKKLIQQRARTGAVANLHHRAGRKPKILASHRCMGSVQVFDRFTLHPHHFRDSCFSSIHPVYHIPAGVTIPAAAHTNF